MKKSALFALFLLLLPLSKAFEVIPLTQANVVCPTRTLLVQDLVKGQGAFSVAISGSAAGFSTTVPLGFWLAQGQARIVYSYITPPSSIKPGKYELVLTISAGQETKEIRHEIIVENCHLTQLEVVKELSMCACENSSLDLKILNKGIYHEHYQVEVGGPASDWVELSTTSLIVEPGSSKIVKAFVKVPCGKEGNYELSFRVKGSTDYAKAEAQTNLKALPCYAYSLEVEKNFWELCDGSELKIPLNLKNKGTGKNSYKINLEGKPWMSVDKSELEVEKDKTQTFNLILNPPYLLNGTFNVSIESLSKNGAVLKKAELEVKVEECYGVSVQLQKEDLLCSGFESSYPITLQNTGKFTNSYQLELDGPAWVSLEKQEIELASNQTGSVTLKVTPPVDIEKNYTITVKARDPISGAEASSQLMLNVLSTKNCYKPSISAEREELEIPSQGSATLALTVENKGIKPANYTLELSGTASSFAQLNPTTLQLEPGKAQTVYVYAAPPPEVALGSYDAHVSLTLEGTAVKATKTIQIKVTEVSEKVTNITGKAVEEVKETKPSLLQRIWDWFKSLFKKRKPTAEVVEIPVNVTNITKIEETVENRAPQLKEELPIIEIRPAETYELNLLDYFEDPDNDKISCIVIKPLNFSVRASGCVFWITPEPGFEGKSVITFFASDGKLLTKAQTDIIVKAKKEENQTNQTS